MFCAPRTHRSVNNQNDFHKAREEMLVHFPTILGKPVVSLAYTVSFLRYWCISGLQFGYVSRTWQAVSFVAKVFLHFVCHLEVRYGPEAFCGQWNVTHITHHFQVEFLIRASHEGLLFLSFCLVSLNFRWWLLHQPGSWNEDTVEQNPQPTFTENKTLL